MACRAVVWCFCRGHARSLTQSISKSDGILEGEERHAAKSQPHNSGEKTALFVAPCPLQPAFRALMHLFVPTPRATLVVIRPSTTLLAHDVAGGIDAEEEHTQGKRPKRRNAEELGSFSIYVEELNEHVQLRDGKVQASQTIQGEEEFPCARKAPHPLPERHGELGMLSRKMKEDR